MAGRVLRQPAIPVAALAAQLGRARPQPALVRAAVDAAAVDAVLAYVAAAARDPVLVPRRGENIVSGERNAWRARGPRPRQLLEGRARGQARLDAPRALVAAWARAWDATCDAAESAVFVTSAGLRTPLHSDPRDSVLVHCAGAKTVVVMPPDQTDRPRTRLDALLGLRTTPGGQGALLLADATVGAAVAACDRLVYDLAPGDALFVPKRWLHDVESATPTVSVATRLRTR